MSKESPREYAVGYAIFADENEARRALEDVRSLQKDRALKLVDAAVISKDLDGRIRAKDIGNIGPAKGAAAGAVMGGLLGVIFPPIGIIGAAVAGGLIGGAGGAIGDTGVFAGDDLKTAANELPAGYSALVVVVEPTSAQALQHATSDAYELSLHTVMATQAGFVSVSDDETST